MPTTLAAVNAAPRPSLIASLASRVALSRGWPRRMIAFASGGIGALALPPFSVFGLMVVPMSAAVWLIDGSAGERRLTTRLRAAFSAGWWWGFGYFLCGLWWVGSAVLVDAEKFAWALPLAVLALPAGLAAFSGAGFALARTRVVRRPIADIGARLRSWRQRMGPGARLHRLSLE